MWVTVLQIKVQVDVTFDQKYFIGTYWQLTATLILLSILLIFDIIKVEFQLKAVQR